MEHNKAEIDMTINRIVSVFDYLRNFDDKHEKLLKDMMMECDYKYIYDKDLMLSEFHVIDCIGKNQLPNLTFISNELNMTKGAISKIASKLLDKNLIKGNRLENNKKEIYYSLTAQGKEIFRMHEMLHEIEREKFMTILNKYNKEELSTINNFLYDLTNEL